MRAVWEGMKMRHDGYMFGGVLAALLVFFMPVPAWADEAALVASVTQKGGGMPEIMAAEHPGVAARSAFAGPWRYGCAYPAKGSPQVTQFCIIQLEHMSGTTIDSGFLLFTHTTPNMKTAPLAQQPWEISFNLPTRLPFGMQAAPSLRIDQGTTIPLTIQSCDGTGCMVQQALTAEQLQALATGQTGYLSAQTKQGEVWSYSFSLADIQLGMREIESWAAQGALAP